VANDTGTDGHITVA